MNNKQNITVGCQLPSIGIILTLIFVVLKLTEHIDWSWWWVLSPLWIGIALPFVLIAAFFVITIAAGIIMIPIGGIIMGVMALVDKIRK